MPIASWFMRQKLMRKVLLSLVPIIIFSVYLFGLRVLALLAAVSLAGILTEYLILRTIHGKASRVSEAVLVSAWLFTLTLPPQTPFWTAILGIVFGVLFGKGVYGGFGRNIFNPALLGRCFVYISFPAYLTANWKQPFTGFPGGFVKYAAGAVTGATPIAAFAKFGEAVDLHKLFFGGVSGSLGETSVLLILAAAVYLILTKSASWKIMVAAAAGFLGFSSGLYFAGLNVPDPLTALMSGGFLFGAVFMATDPVTAPKQVPLQILYGLLIGSLTVLIRAFANFTEGIMFAVLIANAFVPLMELKFTEFTAKKVTS